MADDPREESVSRRRFLSFLVASAAGATVVAAVPVASKVAAATAVGVPAAEPKVTPEPSPAEWAERRRAILRAHEDVVLHNREE